VTVSSVSPELELLREQFRVSFFGILQPDSMIARRQLAGDSHPNEGVSYPDNNAATVLLVTCETVFPELRRLVRETFITSK